MTDVPQEIKDLIETNVNESNEGLVSSFNFLYYSELHSAVDPLPSIF